MSRSPSSLHPFERALLRHLRESALIPAGSRGLVSLSGGADSTALLRGLAALAGPLALKLEVLHFDHGLRPESPAEAEGCAALAARLDLPFHLRRGFRPPPGGTGTQAAARDWRRRESEALLAERGADWIATAHQRDDHWETLLLKLLRGVHLAHIAGLAPRQGPWVRPLLPWPRRELEGYLRALGQDWVEDPSNRSPRYRRNRIRHELWPLLESLAPGGAGARLEALERQSRMLAAWLAAQPEPKQNDPARPPHWIAVAALRALPVLARTAKLHDFLEARMPGLVEAATLERAAALVEQDGPWELHLGRRRTLRRRGERLLLLPREPERMSERAIAGFRVTAPEDWAVRLEPVEAAPVEETLPMPPHPQPEGEPLALVVHGLDPAQPLTVRPRRPGDRFHPPGAAHPVKVADFLRDWGVPLWERERLPLLFSGDTLAAILPRWPAEGHDTGTPAWRIAVSR